MKNNFLRVIFLPLLFLAMGNSPLMAKEIPIELSLDKYEAEIGESVRLELVFNNVQGIPAPQLPQMDGFKSQYLGPSTVMSIVNGKVSGSLTHRYLLIPVKTGKFTIGPFTANNGSNTYKSNAKEIAIVDRAQAPSAQKNSAQADIRTGENLNERIFLILSVDKLKAYVNEKIKLTIKLYINQVSVRGIQQYPVLQEQGYIKEPFTAPKQYKEELGGITYDVVEFNTAIYPAREGELKIGPAKLTCNVAIKKQKRSRSGMEDFFDRDFFDDAFFGDFFNRVQISPIDIDSSELTLNVSALPAENKPDGFNGAVGKFKMQAGSSPKEVTAGDPITVKMRISGEGNFDSVTSPALDSREGFKVYQPQTQKEPDAKIFEQVIIPLSEKITRVPAIKFSYFDTEKKDYVTLVEPAVPVKVSAAREKESRLVEAAAPKEQSSVQKTQILGRDIVYIKEDPGTLKQKGEELYKNRGFIFLQFFPLIFLAAAVVLRKRKDRLSSDVRYARMQRAPKVARSGLYKARESLKNNRPEEFYNYVFKTLQEYLGHRFSRPSAGITIDVVGELISQEGLDVQTAEKLKTCFSECDVARYSSSGIDQEKMKNTLKAMEEVIDCLERKRK